MPRFPEFAARTRSISGSVFEKFRARMAARGEDVAQLHIGDAHDTPPYPLPFDGPFLAAHPGWHRYCDTFGIAPLREALSAKVREDNALDATPARVLVTAGATNALSVSVQALADRGDEVMLLAPFWPFFRGMVRLAGAKAVEVPFYTELYANPDTDVRALLEARLTERTVAIYLNSPNNPSGKVLAPAQIEAVAAFARAHDLWLISDEAYDGMCFDGRAHVSPGALPGMFERTISIFTFSKLFMFAGLRIGYAVAAENVIATLNKTMVHQLYGPSTIAQQMLVEPVRSRAQWRRDFVDRCQRLRDRFAPRLRVAAPLPEGAYYFFFPVTQYLDGRDPGALVEACIDAGVSVAPGADFGEDYADWIRVCYAGVDPERVDTGLERLHRALGV